MILHDIAYVEGGTTMHSICRDDKKKKESPASRATERVIFGILSESCQVVID